MSNPTEYIPLNQPAEYIPLNQLEEEETKIQSTQPLSSVTEKDEISEISDEETSVGKMSTSNSKPKMMRKSKPKNMRKYTTIRLLQPDLTEKECKLLEEQIDILLEETFQLNCYKELTTLYPKLNYEFSMISGIEAQASFVCKMMRKGYVHVYNNNYDQIYNTVSRHIKYNIKKEHLISSLTIIQTNILKHQSITRSFEPEQLLSLSKTVWTKSNDILKDIIGKAYKSNYTNRLNKQSTQKLVKQYRNKITRSMSTEDIENVLNVWKKMIEENKDKVAEIFAAKLQQQSEIYVHFQRANIDVNAQSTVIIDMLDKAINQLTNTDQLIPFLKQIGKRHALLGIKPQLLVLMRKMIMELLKEVLSFSFTKELKDSWNRVLTFIVGSMMIEYSNKRETTEYSRTFSFSKRTFIQNYDSNDINTIENALTTKVILDCQWTWKHINNDTMINNAVKIFYKDLMNSKKEIKDLFARTNMQQQMVRLVRAIGSTVALLDDLDTLITILEELGRRHVYYGVKPEHFKYVKRCWFKMLAQALTLQWNKQINNSWQITWDFMTYHMKTALEDALLLFIPPEPVVVNFKVLINHIDRINLQDLSFFGDIWFAAYTGDNSSQSYAFGVDYINNSKGSKMDGGGVLPFGGIKILNGMQTTDKYRNLKEPYIRYFDEDDTWYLRGNIVGTFSQLFELQHYPFDVHNIELIFALHVDDTIAKFSRDKISVRLMEFKIDSMAGTNYNVYDPQIFIVERTATEGGSLSGRRYTHLKVVIPISRKYIHHTYNVIIPMQTIQLLSFAIYFTDLLPITARLILTMTLFLTLFAFRRAITGSLPPTPYLTVLDHAFNAACLLSIYHVTGLCVINQLQHFTMKTLRIINLIIGLCGLVLYLVIHIYLYIRVRYYISLYPKKEKLISDDHALNHVAKTAFNKSSAVLYNDSIYEMDNF